MLMNYTSGGDKVLSIWVFGEVPIGIEMLQRMPNV